MNRMGMKMKQNKVMYKNQCGNETEQMHENKCMNEHCCNLVCTELVKTGGYRKPKGSNQFVSTHPSHTDITSICS